MGSKLTLSMVCHLVMFRMQGTLNYIQVVQWVPEKTTWCVLVLLVCQVVCIKVIHRPSGSVDHSIHTTSDAWIDPRVVCIE